MRESRLYSEERCVVPVPPGRGGVSHMMGIQLTRSFSIQPRAVGPRSSGVGSRMGSHVLSVRGRGICAGLARRRAQLHAPTEIGHVPHVRVGYAALPVARRTFRSGIQAKKTCTKHAKRDDTCLTAGLAATCCVRARESRGKEGPVPSVGYFRELKSPPVISCNGNSARARCALASTRVDSRQIASDISILLY